MSDLSEEALEFVEIFWNSDTRMMVKTSSKARASLRSRGVEREVRQFLLGVIRDGTMTPEEWGDLFNVQTWEVEDMQEDAKEFWDWLFDDEPLPPAGGPAGVITPPQS